MGKTGTAFSRRDHPAASANNRMLSQRKKAALLGRLTRCFSRPNAGVIFIVEILSVACLIKHPGFEEEAEHRQIYQPCKSLLELETKFRSGRYGLTPYVEIGFLTVDRLPIESITIGPCADPSDEKRSLEGILGRYGYQSVEIRQSGIPLRV